MYLATTFLVFTLFLAAISAKDPDCQNGKVDRNGVCKCRKGYTGKHCEIGVRCCLIYGDPHILTFDGAKINYMGACAYQMAGICPCIVIGEQKKDYPEFSVVMDTWRKGKTNSKVSWARSVTVRVYNHTVKIGQKMQVFVNDAKVSLPYRGIPHAQIEHTGDYVRISTVFGAAVQFDGKSRALICVPKHWDGKTCGICGNNNGNKRDDYVTRDGTDVRKRGSMRDVLIGNSYRDTALMDTSVCTEEKRQISAKPSREWLDKAKDNRHCGYIVDRQGPFSSCIKRLGNDKVMTFYNECMLDVIESQPNHEDAHAAACDFMSAFMTECEEVDAYPSVSWRRLCGCVKKCPRNFEYSFNASACPATCAAPDAPRYCEEENTEGCVCTAGLVLADGSCVHPERCGCTDKQGSYHEVKSEWVDDACTTRFRCTEVGKDRRPEIVSESVCAKDEICKTVDGNVKCVKKPIVKGWSKWGEWSACEPFKEDGGFIQTRVRTCQDAEPENCDGDSYETKTCEI